MVMFFVLTFAFVPIMPIFCREIKEILKIRQEKNKGNFERINE